MLQNASGSSDNSTILLIDDDANTLQLLEETLQSAGYKTQSVPCGAGGARGAGHETGGSSLARSLMPGMDGFQVIRHLRQESTLRDLPIFVMTAKSLTSEEIAILSHETDALVQKNGSRQQQSIAEVDRVVRAGTRARAVGERGRRSSSPKTMRSIVNCCANCSKARGYGVIEACDGQEAISILEETRLDILLLDLNMPVLDGYGLIRRIRASFNLGDHSGPGSHRKRNAW